MNLVQRYLFQPPQRANSAYQDSFSIPCTCAHGSFQARFHSVEKAKGVILFSHGNATDLDDYFASFCRNLANATQFHVLSYDYCGYGKSYGAVPSERCCLANVISCWNWLVQVRYIPSDRIWAMGHSLGCVPSSYLAAMKPIAGLILCSPFLSLRAIASSICGSLAAGLAGLFVDLGGFDNGNMAQHIGCRVLLCHGTQDMIIPLSHSQALAELFKGSVSRYWLQADHDFLFDVEKFNQFLQAFRNWQAGA